MPFRRWLGHTHTDTDTSCGETLELVQLVWFLLRRAWAGFFGLRLAPLVELFFAINFYVFNFFFFLSEGSNLLGWAISSGPKGSRVNSSIVQVW